MRSERDYPAAGQVLTALLPSPLPAGAATLALERSAALAPRDPLFVPTVADSIPGANLSHTVSALTPADPVPHAADVDTLARTTSVGAASALVSMQPPARKPLSPAAALGIGIGCSVAPAMIAAMLDPPGSNSDFAWEAALTTGAALGILVCLICPLSRVRCPSAPRPRSSDGYSWGFPGSPVHRRRPLRLKPQKGLGLFVGGQE